MVKLEKNIKIAIKRAINEGIAAGFKFSNEQSVDDSSYVDFNDSKINDIESLNYATLNKDFISFIENKDFDAANDYLDIYGDEVAKPLKYKVKSYDELLEYLEWDEWLEFIDYSNILSIYIVDKDLNEIEFSDWKPNQINNRNIDFIKISTPKLKETDNEIYISASWKYCNEHIIDPYVSDYGDVVELYTSDYKKKSDLNGFENTQKIKKYIKRKNLTSTLLNKIDAQSRNENFIGYLPAIGQLAILLKYSTFINYVLVSVAVPKIVSTEPLVSSSDADVQNLWSYDITNEYVKASKLLEHKVIPFFKKVNK